MAIIPCLRQFSSCRCPEVNRERIDFPSVSSPRTATTLQQRGFPGRVGPAGSRIARILRVAYRCSVHPGVRLVTRIHVDLLRSASALCL
ncbi:putative leader peptide [Streptomyces camponoticapitis]|uniref:putative leader peptide n=1 Tax=Streptomyces camponoticapitis TaxID=1616125 RepID=UPI0035714199